MAPAAFRGRVRREHGAVRCLLLRPVHALLLHDRRDRPARELSPPAGDAGRLRPFQADARAHRRERRRLRILGRDGRRDDPMSRGQGGHQRDDHADDAGGRRGGYARGARTGASACTSRSSGTGRSGAPPPHRHPALVDEEGRFPPRRRFAPSAHSTASCRPARARDRRAARPGPRRGGRDLPRRLAPPPAQAGAVSEALENVLPASGSSASHRPGRLPDPTPRRSHVLGGIALAPASSSCVPDDRPLLHAGEHGRPHGRTSSWAASTAFQARRWR